MSAKTERVNIISSGDPLGRRSLTQDRLKHMRDGGGKFYGRDKKAAKAEGKRARQEQFVQDWQSKQAELNLWAKERFNLAIERMGKGSETDKDVICILSNDDDFEAFGYRVDRFTFSATEGSEATTIVDFTRPVV